MNFSNAYPQKQLYSNSFRNPISGEFFPFGKNVENAHMNLLFSNTSKENIDIKFPFFGLPDQIEVLHKK